MQKRICPICDHPMKRNHYCSFCKQWVSNPNIINATYYLNERHPAKERSCEYHNPSFMDSNQGSTARQTRSGQTNQPFRQAPVSGNRGGRTPSPNTRQAGNRTMARGTGGQEASSKVKRILMTIGLIWLILTLMGFILPLLFFFI